MVRLRAHHLICLHFYRGEGYDRDFIENLETVLKDASANGVLLVEGCDDVCRVCPSQKEGVCTAEPGGEEKIQRLDRLAKSLLKPENKVLSWSEIKAQIPAIIGEWKNLACESCEWKVVCEKSDAWNKC